MDVSVHKFHAEPVRRTGERFDSKGEAALCDLLRYMRQVGEIQFFLRQVPFHLPGGVVYRLDFLVFYASRQPRYLDFKGAETSDFINKKKQVEELYPVKIECIRRKRGSFIGL